MGFLNCYWHYVVIRLRNGEDVKKKTVIHISPLIYWCVLLRIAFMSVTYYSSPVFIFSVFLHCFELSRIMVSKGMFSKSKYWISEKIRVCQCLFSRIFKSIFQDRTHIFKLCTLRVWSLRASTGFLKMIKGDEYSKMQITP